MLIVQSNKFSVINLQQSRRTSKNYWWRKKLTVAKVVVRKPKRHQTEYLAIPCMGNRKLSLIFDNWEWRITSAIFVLQYEEEVNICSIRHKKTVQVNQKLTPLLINVSCLFIYEQIPIRMSNNKSTINSRNPRNTSATAVKSQCINKIASN